MEFDIRTALLAICVILLLWIIVIERRANEDFETRREKAEAIGNWYEKKGGDVSYDKFKKDLPDVDSVDYERTKNLADKSPRSIERVLPR